MIEPVSIRLDYAGSQREVITYPGAATISVHFTDLRLPPGDFVSVSNPQGTQVYTYPGDAFTLRAGDDGVTRFWPLLIFGDSALVTLHSTLKDDAKAAYAGYGVTIDQVIRGVPLAEVGGASGSCNVDTVCYSAEAYPLEMRNAQAVGTITLGGTPSCTAWRVGPGNHFITGNHCGVNADNISALVLYFDYKNTTCRPPGSDASENSGDGVLVAYAQGAEVLYSNSAYDLTLFTVTEIESYAAFGYLEIDTRAASALDNVYTIHHPNAEEQRISTGYLNGVTSYFGTENPGDGTHLRVQQWQTGTTEGGSSGAPLFSASSHQVIGLLHGGLASCANPTGSDWYARLDVIWPEIAPYLVTPYDEVHTAGEVEQVRLPYRSTLETSAATASADDPVPSCVAVRPEHTVWYTYTATRTGNEILIDTTGSTYDTVLSVWRGSPGAWFQVACNDNAGAETTSALRFSVQEGTTYTVMVGAKGAEAGQLVLNLDRRFIGPPRVKATTPAAGASDAATSDQIDIAFDMPVNVAAGALDLYCDAPMTFTTQPALPASRTESIRLLPDGLLPLNTDCVVTLRTGAITNSDDGQVLASNDASGYKFSFIVTRDPHTAEASITPEQPFGDPPLPTTLVQVVPVTVEGTLLDLQVKLDIEHTFVSDLKIMLTSPAGTNVLLYDKHGGDGDHLTHTVFDDDAAQSIEEGIAPFNGAYRPVTALSVLWNEPVQGDWVLTVLDTASRDDGVLKAVTLDLTYNGDGTPPQVTSTTLLNDGALLHFDEPVTLTEDAALLACPDTVAMLGLPVLRTATLHLSFDVPPGAACTLTLYADQTVDNAGQALDGNGDGAAGGDYVFTFTSGAQTPEATPAETEEPTPASTDEATPIITVTASPPPTVTPTAITVTPPPTLTPPPDDNTQSTPTPSSDATPEVLHPGDMVVRGNLNQASVRPDFVWMPVAGLAGKPTPAEWYNVVITDEHAAVTVLDTWFPAADICVLGVCVLTPSRDLLPVGFINGTYAWRLRAWVNDSLSAFTDPVMFTVDAPLPQRPIGLGVSLAPLHPVLTLHDDPGMAWVHLYLETDTGQQVYHGWVEKQCTDGLCTVTPDVYPANGSYRLYVQTWGPAGYSAGSANDWTGPITFSLGYAPPATAENLAVQISERQPIFTWDAVTHATWYEVWVGTADFQTTHYQSWFAAKALTCGAVCTLRLTEFLPAETDLVWYVRSWGPGGLSAGGEQGWAAGPIFTR
ncbi:MAG: hypothetical protein OHK0046_24950 [Anaerolineae bacterium]